MKKNKSGLFYEAPCKWLLTGWVRQVTILACSIITTIKVNSCLPSLWGR